MRRSQISERITDYLSSGGLFNPELMDHQAVRDLMLMAREEIDELYAAAYPELPAPQDVKL